MLSKIGGWQKMYKRGLPYRRGVFRCARTLCTACRVNVAPYEPTFNESFNKFRSTRKFSDRMKIEVELASQAVTVRGNKRVCVCVYAIFQNNTVLRSLSF